MLELNREILLEVAADAIVQAELNLKDESEKKRWVKAIAKGVAQLEENPAFITWQAEEKSLLILSDSNRIYSANGVCQCEAYLKGKESRNLAFPCWHRALARLVRIYFEITEKPAKRKRLSDFSDMPYLKMSSERKLEKLGSVRF